MSLLSRFEKNISERGESLRVGLVGAGQMGQGIVAQLNKTKGVDLQLIVDKNQDKLEKALEKYTSQDKKTVLSQKLSIAKAFVSQKLFSKKTFLSQKLFITKAL